MKVLTAAQMREVDRRTSALGIPSLVLMENAGQRVVELLAHAFSPLSSQRVAILCGKGNNGGDGMVVARQLFSRGLAASVQVVLAADPEELRGDALENYRMLLACGCPVAREITPQMRFATIVVDALLGTGIKGAASGRMLDFIREINTGFPLAQVVAVDIPSGMASDTAASEGETVRAAYTVTFTAPKVGMVLPPNCGQVGKLVVAAIGSPPSLYEDDAAIYLSLSEPRDFGHLFQPRKPDAHKGDFGHVLIVAGSRGKTGAAAMAGMAALRAGAGLVTVASAESAIPVIATHAPELMTEPLPETDTGGISVRSFDYGRLDSLAEKKSVIALGPGLGTHTETVEVVARLFRESPQPMVVDADALNALSSIEWKNESRLRVLTPHPGEMARLTGKPVLDRLGTARAFAVERNVVLVLKGQRTLIAHPDGRVWINPTGSPAMATAGTGDVLTGTIAALLAQFPTQPEKAVAAAVYVHGRAGELGASDLGEKCLVATDLLRYYPQVMKW